MRRTEMSATIWAAVIGLVILAAIVVWASRLNSLVADAAKVQELSTAIWAVHQTERKNP